MPRDDQWQAQLVRDVSPELPGVVRSGDVNHIGFEFPRRLDRLIRVTPEQQVVPEIGVQLETEISASERKLRHAARGFARVALRPVNAEQGQIAPFGESDQLPARVRDAVDFDERIGKERDARLNSHSPPPLRETNHEETLRHRFFLFFLRLLRFFVVGFHYFFYVAHCDDMSDSRENAIRSAGLTRWLPIARNPQSAARTQTGPPRFQ